MAAPTPAVPLIVDPDPKFIETLMSEAIAKERPPITAVEGKAAQLALADSNNAIAGLFVNMSVQSPPAVSVIKSAHVHRPALPIFILKDAEGMGMDEREMKRLAVQRVLDKPVTYQKLLDIVAPRAVVFDPKSALERSKEFQDKLDTEITAEDAEFAPVMARNFLSGSQSYFDVYVRLSGGKYLKILQGGDTFSIDRLTGYLKKGVTHFYIRKKAQDLYLNYCDQISTTLVKSDKVSASIKVSQTLHFGEQTINYFRNVGLSEDNIRYASDFLTNVQDVANKLDQTNYDLKGLLADIAAYEHGVSTSLISSMILGPLGMASARPVDTVGMAALLHDIGLYRLPEELRHEDMTKMTIEQQGMFKTHPGIGANILSQIKGIQPVVIQAVEQHHARRNKSGFPSNVTAGNMSFVAEIIGISDEFAHLLEKIGKTDFNPVAEMEKRLTGFSNKISDAFRHVFIKRPAAKKSAA